MVKDAWSAWTEETLDCLHGTIWFNFLVLKLGYWQMEMDESTKLLTTFTVGPLGFHE